MVATFTACVFITAWLYRVEQAYYCWLDSKKPIPAPAPAKETKPLPADLMAYARSQGSDWAQQQTLDALYELYGQHGHDWDTVRKAIGYNTGTI